MTVAGAVAIQEGGGIITTRTRRKKKGSDFQRMLEDILTLMTVGFLSIQGKVEQVSIVRAGMGMYGLVEVREID